jgi:hypothetical protein
MSIDGTKIAKSKRFKQITAFQKTPFYQILNTLQYIPNGIALFVFARNHIPNTSFYPVVG